MKHIGPATRKVLFALFGAALLVLSAGVHKATSAAGTASFSLSPSSGTFVQNTTISVVINVTSPDPINVIEADLLYDSSKLQFLSIDFSGSAFSTPAVATGGGGSVQIARGTSPGTTVSGTQKVGSVAFKVLGGSGATSVSFANTCHIVRAADSTEIWNGITSGGSYSLSTPTPT
ncbi:MAG: cohesin domain-containing protein, partial [Candidatus Saccharimonadales bacterium]